MHEHQTITVLKALADGTRLDIVRRLARDKDGASCGEISTCSRLSQPAMSHHFGKLVEAGILLEHKTGKEKHYELNTQLLECSGINITNL